MSVVLDFAGRSGVVLVRLPNWLGDTVMALPALHGLRAARPRASVIAVGRWASLLAGQGVADALVHYPRERGRCRRLDASLKDLRADAAILFPNSFGSALSAWRWGAGLRLGYDADARRVFLTHAVPLPSPRAHQIDEYRELVEAAGVTVAAAEPAWRLGADPEADASLHALLEERSILADSPVVGLHLGASFGSSKLWPATAYAELAHRLRDRGLQPLCLGSPDDADLAGAVSRAAGSAVPSLLGQEGLDRLPRLLARLACLVSSDTGVAHLAAAVGTPTVTLFGPTDPRLTAPRSRAARRVEGRAPCAPCFLKRCPIDHVCMRNITAASVASAVEESRAA
jgi:heptosyltransferase-2